MDLIIKNASLEQITVVCSRIATPSFNEMMDNERLEAVAGRMAAGETAEQAKLEWQSDLNEKAAEVLKEKEPEPAPVQAEVEPDAREPLPGQVTITDTGLHLDGPPESLETEKQITSDDIAKIAGALAKQGKTGVVVSIIKQYGVKKLIDLQPQHLKPAYDQLKVALDGGAR